ncbi:NAD-dependent epimerase/dehydratase family protein, partial [Methylobacterium sp. E-066]|uniref:NAD-dependent epimerase/dehydratase family protein n=1 Tax=Methylobacterium sp. E-066 TaxID=2836584 RepID=UPI001FB93115
MAVLVTGGAGYIGSHMVLALLDAGHDEIVVLDDLSTGFDWAVPEGVKLVVGDVADQALVTQTILQHRIDAPVHLAPRIVVPDSVADPPGYSLPNTVKPRALIDAATPAGVRHVIFS